MITKEQARRLAEVATAIAEGKLVAASFGGLEYPIDELDPDMEYTIHEPPPEPKYRPWTLEEAIDNIGRVVREDGAARLIVSVHDYEGIPMICLGGLEKRLSSTYVRYNCQFLDGTPCGVQE